MSDIALLQKQHQGKIELQASIANKLNSLSLDAEMVKEKLDSEEGIDALLTGEQRAKREALLLAWKDARDDVDVSKSILDSALLVKEAEAIPVGIQQSSHEGMVSALKAYHDGTLDPSSSYYAGGALEFPQPYIKKNAQGVNEATPYPVKFNADGEFDLKATERMANQLLEGNLSPANVGGSIPLTLLGIFRETVHYNRIMARADVRNVPYIAGSYSGTRRAVPRPAGIVVSGGDINERDPSYTPVNVTIYKYGARVEVDYEGENSVQPWGLINDVGMSLTESIMLGTAMHHAIGTGVNQPMGLVTGLGSDQTTAVATGAALKANITTKWTGISGLWVQLKPAYRSSRSFTVMAASTPFGDIASMTDEENSNRPLFRWNENEDTMPIIDGYLANRAVMEVPEMTHGAAGNMPVAVGALDQYLVIMAGGLRVEQSDHVKFANDQIVVRALQSSGAALSVPEAFRRVVTTAA